MSTSLNETGHFTNGVCSSLAMVAAMQPAFTVKTWVMGGKGLPPQSELYRGMLPNCIAVGPAQGAGFVGYAAGLKLVAKDPKNPTSVEKFQASLVAGFSGTPFATAFERIMIVQQMHGLTTRQAVQAIQGKFMKGFVPTSCRELLATAALFSTGDTPEEKFAYGFHAGVLSAPFDRVKTVMQGALQSNTSFAQTAKDLVIKEGLQAMFKGALFRGTLVGWALVCMGQAKGFFPNYLPSSMHRLLENTDLHRE